MKPFPKFVYLIFPLFAGVLFLGLVFIADSDEGLKGMEGWVGLEIILLLVNLPLYRRHVANNNRLGPVNRDRSMKAVTLFGPLGQLAYYNSHIHPFGADDPPQQHADPDVPRTEADDFIGL